MSKLPPPMNLEGMNLEAIHEAIQDCHDWPGKNHPDDTYHLGMRAVCTAMRLESALEAAQQEIAARDAEIAKMQEQFREFAERSESDAMELRKEIADLKRGGVVVPELPAETALALIAIDWPNRTIDIIATARNIREWFRKSARTIPADRELMRLVDELIRWHGLRPLDKRPDHAAVLVGAIKALRAQPTQEPTT